MEELPRYLEIIDDIDAALDRDRDGRRISRPFRWRFEQAWFRLEGRGLDWLLALGGELSEEQVQEFLAALWKKQEKYEKKYLERMTRSTGRTVTTAWSTTCRITWGDWTNTEAAAGRCQRQLDSLRCDLVEGAW